ncbi:MAG: gamma-glutamyl-gamma-aminobutyrate hydrolase family protein [Limibacillus sp.]
MSRRPLIGVTASRRGGRFMWWFNRFSVWRHGGRACRLVAGKPFDPKDLDGLIVGGGDDIGPMLYSGEIDPAVSIDPERDALELYLLGEARTLGLPVLGICRGAQMINVSLGGNLHRDISKVYDGVGRRKTPLPLMTVTIEPDSRLAAMLERTRARVNALHHQSVDRIGRGLKVVARDHLGIVQALESSGSDFLFGVQWHPEFLIFDRGQQRLFRRLIRHAREQALERGRTGGKGQADRASLGRP